MPFHAVNHVGFAVSDLARSVRFYTRVLGVEPYFDEVYDVEYLGRLVGYPGAVQHAAFFALPGQADMFLELIQYLNPTPGIVELENYNVGNAHLCLACDDLQEAYDLIIDAGGTITSQGMVSTDYGVYDGTQALYCRDPDGIALQIVQLPPGVDPGGRPGR